MTRSKLQRLGLLAALAGLALPGLQAGAADKAGAAAFARVGDAVIERPAYDQA